MLCIPRLALTEKSLHMSGAYNVLVYIVYFRHQALGRRFMWRLQCQRFLNAPLYTNTCLILRPGMLEMQKGKTTSSELWLFFNSALQIRKLLIMNALNANIYSQSLLSCQSLRFRTIKAIFTTAKNNQPCVVILESFECLSYRSESESENPRRLITEIAVQVSGTCLDNSSLKWKAVFLLFLTWQCYSRACLIRLYRLVRHNIFRHIWPFNSLISRKISAYFGYNLGGADCTWMLYILHYMLLCEWLISLISTEEFLKIKPSG